MGRAQSGLIMGAAFMNGMAEKLGWNHKKTFYQRTKGSGTVPNNLWAAAGLRNCGLSTAVRAWAEFLFVAKP